MADQLDELYERLEDVASDSGDIDCVFARAIGGMLVCAPHVGREQREDALTKALEGIDRLGQRLGEVDERVTILRQMYDIVAG